MVNRFWDKNNKYKSGFLKEYKYWVWEVNHRQHTLGSFIIFSKNQNIEKISELSNEEIKELKEAMGEIEDIFSKIDEFKPDRFNYWQMGNRISHLHIHGFPRYAKPRIFVGKEWTDKTWGNPPVWQAKEDDNDLIIKVRDVIKAYI